MDNRHSKFIPDSVLKQVQDMVNQVNTLLLPYVTPLTPAERQALPKMGEKTISFVEKAHEFAAQNPNLCPPYLDMTEFDTDYADARNLVILDNTAKQLYEAVDDTAMVAGSESYQASLVFYNSVKVAARQDIPGAKAVYEELKKRFPQGSHKKAADAGETAQSAIR
jgi:hypothetical protein